MRKSAGFRVHPAADDMGGPGAWTGATAGQDHRSVWADDSLLDVGTGPVVVLVHGLGSRKEDWLPVIAPLSQKYRLLVPDQIGFGRSDKPLIDYSIQTYVDFLNELLRQLRWRRRVLLANRWRMDLRAICGGDYRRGASDPRGEISTGGCGGLKQDKAIPDLNPSSLAGMRTLMQAVFYDTSWLNEDALRKVFADKLATHDGYTVRSLLNNPALGSERLDNQLANIKVLTLVVWGKQDSLLPIAAEGTLRGGNLRGAAGELRQVRHVPSTEKTEEFLAAVNAFLGSGAPATH